MLDYLLLIDDDKDLAQVAGSYNSVNCLQLAEVGKMLREGRGTPMELVVQITQAFTSGGAATLNVAPFTATSAAYAGLTLQGQTGVQALATLTLGRKFRLPLHLNNTDTDAAFFGVQYTIGTATTTAGKCSAWIQAAGSDQSSFAALY